VIGLFDRLARPLLGLMDAENAHRLAIHGLKVLPRRPAPAEDKRLSVRVFGLNFPNPVGMAAGFDKHGEVPDALLRLASVLSRSATVTPLPQAGNPRRGCFGCRPTKASSTGSASTARADRRCWRGSRPSGAGGLVGSMLGPTRSPDRIADYVSLNRDFCAGRELFHGQHLVPQHAPAARPAAGQLFDDLLARVSMRARA